MDTQKSCCCRCPHKALTPSKRSAVGCWLSSKVNIDLLFCLCLCTCFTCSTALPQGLFYTALMENQKPQTYIINGITCFKCGPGTFVSEHCHVNFKNSSCSRCPPGTYQSDWNQAESCGPCDKNCNHDSYMITVQQCTETNNMKCGCRPGYFLFIIDKYFNIKECRKHTECQHGQIVIKNGTSTSDTECSPCQETFYSESGHCHKCTSCQDQNMMEISPCSSMYDAVCEPFITQETTAIMTSTTHQPYEPKDNTTVIAVAAVLILLAVVIPISIWIGFFKWKRRKGHEGFQQIELSVISPPEKERMLQRSLSSSSSTSATNVKRVRSLSESSMRSYSNRATQHIPLFTELTDPEVWFPKVSDLLTKRLDVNWKQFMRSLPGSREFKSCIGSRCEQITMEICYVPEQIHKALQEWYQGHDTNIVTVDNILSTLQKMFCDDVYEDVKELCLKLARDSQEDVFNCSS